MILVSCKQDHTLFHQKKYLYVYNWHVELLRVWHHRNRLYNRKPYGETVIVEKNNATVLIIQLLVWRIFRLKEPFRYALLKVPRIFFGIRLRSFLGDDRANPIDLSILYLVSNNYLPLVTDYSTLHSTISFKQLVLIFELNTNRCDGAAAFSRGHWGDKGLVLLLNCKLCAIGYSYLWWGPLRFSNKSREGFCSFDK